MRRLGRKTIRTDDSGIDLTPMLDVVFIMLVFFVATTTLSTPTSVKVKLPRSDTAEEVNDEVLQVSLLADGTVLMNEKPLLLRELEEESRQFATRRALPRAVIEADSDVRTEDLIVVMDKIRLGGIEEIGLAAEVE
jgi:biopolymer transport protein ExbD